MYLELGRYRCESGGFGVIVYLYLDRLVLFCIGGI